MTAQPRLLGGRYEIGGMIGYGGMAEVHRGSDLRLGRDVAIKMLRTDLARDETFLTRFRREAQNAASLNHPSIVAVYDTGEDTTTGTPVPYIVMEYVEGRTLKEVLTTEGRLTPRRACEILADTCAALDFSHRHQIIHRDVKPGNVMLSSNGQVKVMDFGIARAMASGQATMTQTSAVIGTAQYLSPEQARGETVDARSDVYAVGCLLYELLCGDPPFTGDNPVSVAYQHVREAPTPPSHINPEVPPAVDAIVLHALAKNSYNRYQTAGEMRDDLERAIAGRPVLAAPAMAADNNSTQLLGAAEGDQTRVAPAAHQAPKKKRTGRNVLVACLVLLLVAGLGVGAFFLASAQNTVAVPDVVGQTEAEAKESLDNDGFSVEIEEAHSDDVVRGEVMEQSPDPAEEEEYVAEDTTVTLTVSIGKEEVEVPDLSGNTTCQKMKQELEDLRLKADCEQVSSDQPSGALVSQDPEHGDMVAPGETVQIEVSKGDMRTAPPVVSMNEEEACKSIEDAGFTCQVEYVEPKSDESPGTVIAQAPTEDDDALSEGETVTINVAGVEIPDLTGLTVEEANQQYGDQFTITAPDDAKPDWMITEQESDEGSEGDYVKEKSEIRVQAEEDSPGLPLMARPVDPGRS